MSLRSHMKSEGVEVDVAQRLKREVTIVDKLSRIPEMQLSRMHDIGGCRAIVPTGAYHAIAGIRRRLDRSSVNEVVRIYDYIEEPKPTGYRAVHVVVRRDGRLIEIQLRTTRQQAWAEYVEQLGAVTEFNLKDGQGPDVLLDYLRTGATIVALQEQNQEVGSGIWADWERLRTAVAPYLPRQGEET